MTEPRWGYFLTTQRDPTGHDNPDLLAIISDGTPQRGHDPVTVLTMDFVPSQAAAEEWFRKMLAEKPWEPRQ